MRALLNCAEEVKSSWNVLAFIHSTAFPFVSLHSLLFSTQIHVTRSINRSCATFNYFSPGTRIINQWSGMQFAKTAINGRGGSRATATARESTVIILFRLQEILWLLFHPQLKKGGSVLSSPCWLSELHDSSNERCNYKSDDCISFLPWSITLCKWAM